jgi:hypothetical protein
VEMIGLKASASANANASASVSVGASVSECKCPGVLTIFVSFCWCSSWLRGTSASMWEVKNHIVIKCSLVQSERNNKFNPTKGQRESMSDNEYITRDV